MKLLLTTLVVAAGCQGLSSPPQPLVSVLKQDGGCFALMTQQRPIDPALGIMGTCTLAEVPQLLAGIDRVEVVIDYGPDVDFDASTDAPPPTVSVVIDGTASPVPIALSGPQLVGSRVYFIATFTAPTTLSSNVQIIAGVNAGFTTTVATLFSIVPPPVALVIDDCTTGMLCEFAGAVGSAHFTVSVPGTVPQIVTIHSKIDGVLQPDPIPPVTTLAAGDHTEVTTAIPVPAARDGALWILEAQVDAQPPTSQGIIIYGPAITTELSCGAMCNVATGDLVGLQITAPALIRPLEALIDTTINGVPQLVSAPVTLVPNADGTATGLTTLVAPATTGAWQIDVSVAGYSADPLDTTVH